MEIGGYTDQIDWPKLGPSLLIASCLIVAIRTARWPATVSENVSEHDLEKEIEYAVHVAGRVPSIVVSRKEALFPRVRKPWYQPDDTDVPK